MSGAVACVPAALHHSCINVDNRWLYATAILL